MMGRKKVDIENAEDAVIVGEENNQKKIDDPRAEKLKALNLAISGIEKEYGKGSIMKLDENTKFDIDVIESGNISIDACLGVGGYPRGRIVEVLGPESSGKTTLALHAIAEAQKSGGIAAFVDAEHALDPQYAKALGVNLNDLWISQPDNGEQALDIVENLVDSNAVDIIVIDSVAALTPRAEIEGDMGDSVTFDTPIYIRNKKNKAIDIIPISDLFKLSLDFSGQKWYKKFKTIEVLTHQGWKDIHGVVAKNNTEKKKPIYVVKTVNGYVKATADHCFFQNKKECSLKELKRFDRLDIYEDNIEGKKIKSFLNKEIAWLLGFWIAEGSFPRTNLCNRFEVCSVDQYLVDKCKKIVNDNFLLNADIRLRENETKKPLYILSCSSEKNLGFLIQQCVCENSKLKKIPSIILNSVDEIKVSFLDGFFQGDGSHKNQDKVEYYYNDSLPVIAGLQFLLKSLNKTTAISIDKNRLQQLILRVVESERTKIENEICDIKEYTIPDYLYDISTEAGTFITALGNIVIHNSHMGLQARLMSQALRKLTGKIFKSKTCVIFINQLRMKIGVMFGSPETTTGGRALKFYASVRIDVRKTETITQGDVATANKTKIKIVKNKVAPPFRECDVEIEFGKGINKYKSLVDCAAKFGIVDKAGSWYSYKDKKIGQGSNNVRQFLIDNPSICNEIEKLTRQIIFKKDEDLLSNLNIPKEEITQEEIKDSE